jgi:hypothetical protein
MWGDNDQEVVPVQPGEVVCGDCHLVYHAGNPACTNCELWYPSTEPIVAPA